MAAGCVILSDHARRLNLACPVHAACALPPLILLTDEDRFPDPRPAVAHLPPGGAVILRHYGDRSRAALAQDLRILCEKGRLRLLIAADGRLASRIGADGLHLPEHLVHRAGAWRARQPAWLITAAAHGRRGLVAAARWGTDAALLAPVFATRTHPRARALGPVRFTALVRRSRIPVYALGGVSAATAPRLRNSGCAGLAAIDAAHAADRDIA